MAACVCSQDNPLASDTVKEGEKKALPFSGTGKVLVVYFSHTGNTREIANQIHGRTGGDVFEIRAVDPYPGDYEEVKKRAKEELGSGYKPALKERIGNIGSYDIVFIGYPIWWGTFPAPVRTFLSEYDLKGKTIVPFCTHQGSGLGRSVTDISKLCPGSTVLDGLAVWGRDAQGAQREVSVWLGKMPPEVTAIIDFRMNIRQD
ncbi:MAG: flavodoxin [Spirochaetes bacterium]|nr:MAG: flavodoxin [Spirochaetota bacterium]